MRAQVGRGRLGVKIVFMGTPQFAVPVLRRLHAEKFRVAAVYTQPARKQGRGLRLVQPPAAQAAEELGLPLRQPKILQRRAEHAVLEKLAPDVIVTAAYGKIFRRRLLDLPRFGCINLHPSLLPRYRGLTPIPWAILRGEAVTGVTVYRMDEAVDAGPILGQRAVAIRPDDTGGSLGQRLAEHGVELVCSVLRGLQAGGLKAWPQDPELASYAPRLGRDDGRLDWRLPATQIARQVRALQPWPGTFSYWRGLRVKILEVAVVDETLRRVPPGTLLSRGGKQPPVVAALPGAVALRRVQCENARPQDGIAFCCGRRVTRGDRLRGHPVQPGETDRA
jgi:methionyl-tRNA formyltransferase